MDTTYKHVTAISYLQPTRYTDERDSTMISAFLQYKVICI